jgi:hypothetical protein
MNERDLKSNPKSLIIYRIIYQNSLPFLLLLFHRINNKTDITINPQTKFPTNQTNPKLTKTKRILSNPEIPAAAPTKPTPSSPAKKRSSLKNPASSPPTNSPPLQPARA